MASDWPLGSTWPRNRSRGEVPKRELKASDVLRSMLRVLETGADASDAELRLWMAEDYGDGFRRLEEKPATVQELKAL